MNFKGLGKHQRALIAELKSEPAKYIVHFQDFGNMNQEFTVNDDANTYKNISLQLFQSLLDRKLLDIMDSSGSLHHNVTKFKLKDYK